MKVRFLRILTLLFALFGCSFAVTAAPIDVSAITTFIETDGITAQQLIGGAVLALAASMMIYRWLRGAF